MRRYDLDWLRVIAFALLIFYHVGMFFVPWSWHIKNNETSEWLTLPMWFLNQWRLPLLFVISGMGTYFSLQKRTGGQFMRERVIRLLIPFVFGMLFIIPPQVYIERLENSQFTGSYFDFWPSEAFIGTYPEGNISWHHLWFILYLLLFSLVLTPLFISIKKGLSKGSGFKDKALKENILSGESELSSEMNFWSRFNLRLKKIISKPLGLYLFVGPLFLWEWGLQPFFPVTHALVGDWFTIISSITLFLFGFIIITTKECFWHSVKRYRNIYLTVGIVCFSAMVYIVNNYGDSLARHTIEAMIKVINLWSWIIALFGFAARYLNRNSSVLQCANQAVYPFYILHQTVIVIIGYYMIDLGWSPGIKASVMIIGTFGITWMIYEFLIRRWRFIRPLFGLKEERVKAADTLVKNYT